MVPLALVTAAGILVAWFPFASLWHQQAQLDATASQINVIKQQQQALSLQAKSMSSLAAATMLAREEYQLVAPGQSLIQVLPGDQSGKLSPSSGDPGLQPLVSPLSVTSPVGTGATGTSHARDEGFLSRLVRTLEFWR